MEQQVMGFLMLSMTKDVMVQVVSCSTPREVWTLLEQTYALNTRMALATTEKGNMTILEYIGKMKSLAYEVV
jgi:hypothetical protein